MFSPWLSSSPGFEVSLDASKGLPSLFASRWLWRLPGGKVSEPTEPTSWFFWRRFLDFKHAQTNFGYPQILKSSQILIFVQTTFLPLLLVTLFSATSAFRSFEVDRPKSSVAEHMAPWWRHETPVGRKSCPAEALQSWCDAKGNPLQQRSLRIFWTWRLRDWYFPGYQFDMRKISEEEHLQEVAMKIISMTMSWETNNKRPSYVYIYSI